MSFFKVKCCTEDYSCIEYKSFHEIVIGTYRIGFSSENLSHSLTLQNNFVQSSNVMSNALYLNETG